MRHLSLALVHSEQTVYEDGSIDGRAVIAFGADDLEGAMRELMPTSAQRGGLTVLATDDFDWLKGRVLKAQQGIPPLPLP